MDRRLRDGRPAEAPVLQALRPDDVRDAAWLRDVLDRGACTYDVAIQSRTARRLF